ncbi:MAG: NAD/FAD-dependent oxidoreductase, partial [Cyanobacteria bacterium J083]
FQADYLLMTPPLPQSLALLQKSNIVLPPDLQSSLEKITYNKCLAVLAYGEKPSHIPAPGGLNLTGEPLAWLACNQQKGISPQATAITLHAGKEFSENNWENDEQTIVNELLNFAAPWLGSSVVKYQLHRWRYSQPSQIYPKPYVALTEPALILAGDAFMAPKIEGAFLSGLAAAEYLLNKLS